MYKLLSEKKSFLWRFWNRDGKGVEPGEDTTPTLKYFFKLFWRRFPRLLSLNLMMLGQVVPLIVAVVVYLLSNTTPTQSSLLFAPLYGISTIGTAPAASVWLTTISDRRADFYPSHRYRVHCLRPGVYPDMGLAAGRRHLQFAQHGAPRTGLSCLGLCLCRPQKRQARLACRHDRCYNLAAPRFRLCLFPLCSTLCSSPSRHLSSSMP